MTDTVAAELRAEFTSTGFAKLRDEYKTLHQATKDLGDAMDAVAGKHHAFWASLTAPAGIVADLKAAHTAIKDIHTLMGQSAPTQFATSLHSGITQAESAWDRLASKIRGGLGSINLPGSQRGGFDLLGGLLGVASGPLGMVGGALGSVGGAGLGLLGGAAGAVGGAAGAVGGFGLDQFMGGMSDVAAIDAARMAVAAHMGTDYTQLTKAEARGLSDEQQAAALKAKQQKLLAQVTQNAFLLSSAPETGKVDSIEALAAMDEIAKAGVTDPQKMLEMATTALQLRAAGGESKISTDNAVRLLITGKNVFGGKYDDKTVANAINGLVNATTLDINQIQGIIKNAGSANVSGMDLTQYFLEAGMMGQAGVNPGQIGGGIKQILQMSQPKTDSSKAAMAQLGLISTETHSEGGTPGTAEYWETQTDPLTGKQRRVHHAATKGKQGKEVTTITDNKLWDAKGNIDDPATFFKKLLDGTKGMTNEQSSDLVGRAFNAKAAGYINQVLGFYRDNPDAFDKLAAQMKQQSDVAVTAATQNDNLDTALRNLGDTVQNLKDGALIPLLEPLKGFVNQLTKLGQDAMKGDWGAFKVDLGKFKADLLAKLTEARTWINTNAPKIFETVKSGVLDVSKILFGADVTAKVQAFFTKDLPAAWNGAVGTVKGLVNFFDTTLKPILLGTDAERTTAMQNLTGMISSGVGNFLSKDLPALLDKSKNPIVKSAMDIGGALGAGMWNGFKATDFGQMIDFVGRGDIMGLAGYMSAHGYAGAGIGGKDDLPLGLPAWMGGGGVGGTGKGSDDTSHPPPGKTWADGHYEKGVWVNTVLPSMQGAGPPLGSANAPDFGPGSQPPPPPSSRGTGRGVDAPPVVVINTHPGDKNTYTVAPVSQQQSQNMRNYQNLSAPRS